ncbi:hypothetical protein [uncultured Veillonella sp.]|uniref:hypothetical protein n=1 Tax=uncultured Veillonella sp. TaxID=159268 RepID=UPI00265F3809|nr:hypothetical protein [uncultured Veillonella sp.]
MGNVKYLDFDEAKKGIIEATHRLVSVVDSLNNANYDTYLDVFAEKFILDCMDYCHRADFPRTLIYTASELAVKYIKDKFSDTHSPLKSLKENDVEFTWAVEDVSPIGCISEKDFESIRTKLNLYRKVVWSNG